MAAYLESVRQRQGVAGRFQRPTPFRAIMPEPRRGVQGFCAARAAEEC